MTRLASIVPLFVWACAFPFQSGPQLVDDMSDIPWFTATENDLLSSPVVRGATYHMRWTGSPHATLVSSDPGVLEVGEPVQDGPNRLFPVIALQPGFATITVEQGRHTLDTNDVEVRDPDTVRFVPLAADHLDRNDGRIAIAANTPVRASVRYLAEGDALAGRLPIEPVPIDGVQLTPVDVPESVDNDVVDITASAGTHVFDWAVTEGVLTAEIASLESDEVLGIEVDCSYYSGLGCVAFGYDADGAVWGIPATWSRRDETFDSIGDRLVYTGEPGISVFYDVTWGAMHGRHVARDGEVFVERTTQ
jgi:hypothetical protein